jgi:hypothetical protein
MARFAIVAALLLAFTVASVSARPGPAVNVNAWAQDIVGAMKVIHDISACMYRVAPIASNSAPCMKHWLDRSITVMSSAHVLHCDVFRHIPIHIHYWIHSTETAASCSRVLSVLSQLGGRGRSSDAFGRVQHNHLPYLAAFAACTNCFNLSGRLSLGSWL